MVNVLLVVTSLALGQAEGPQDSDSDLKLQVASLVRQLDDDELAQRVEAEKELIALGPRVLDLLPEVTPRTSAEVKERLRRIRTSLEKTAADAATKTSVVTLKGEMSLSDALAALEKQTGNRIEGSDERGGMVTVDFKDTPYWKALDDILDQVGLTVNAYGGYTGALSLTAAPDDALPRSTHAAYSGVFRFEPVQVTAVRDLRNPAVNALRITLEVAWEPRTLPISLSIPADQLVLKDDNGTVIGGEGNQGSLEGFVQADIPVVEFRVPFELPDRDSKKIGFKAKLMSMIPGRKETFEFSKLKTSRDVQKRKGGVTVTFERVRKNAQLQELRMRLTFDKANNALESHRGWVYNNKAYLVDADGKEHVPATFETTRQTEDEVGLAYLFPMTDEQMSKCKFVYETPASIVSMPVEFELPEIELP